MTLLDFVTDSANDNKMDIIKNYCITIDSKDRDTVRFPYPTKFDVKFSGKTGAVVDIRLRNVVTVSLIEAVIPTAAFSNQRYLLLRINNLKDDAYGSNEILSSSFATLLPDKEYGNVTICRLKSMCNCFKEFSPPKVELSSLSIELLQPDGELADTGISTEDSAQILLSFEIKTLEYSDAKLTRAILI